MVSKKLQDKFYAALESLKDGKNDYILEALAAGAKATFEGMLTGEVSEDGTYIPSKDEVPRSASIGPDSCPRVLTKEDIQMLTHDPETEREEDPEELNFDSNEAKRFPTYPGQFSEEDDYAMVAEAVTKLGNAISEMKTANNAPLIEAIKEGFKCCFEAVAEQPMTMRVEHTVDDSLPDKNGEFKEQEVVYVQVNDHITVRITHDYCEYLEDNHLEKTVGFPDVEFHPSGMRVEHTVDDNLPDKSGEFKEQEVVYVQVNDRITVRITHDYCEYLVDNHLEETMGFPDDEIHTTPEQAMETAQQEKILNNF